MAEPVTKKIDTLPAMEEPFSFVALEAAAQTADHVIELLKSLVGNLHLPCASLVVDCNIKTEGVGE